MENRKSESKKTKGGIRKSGVMLELCVLTFVYFWVWRFFYRGTSFPYYGRGKYILAGIYALLILVLFVLNESSKFGYMKLNETIISQCTSIFVVDLITYFQLCLIANVMIDPFPIFFLLIIDFIICALFTVLFTKFYINSFAPKRLLLIYGNDNAVNLKFKMDERSEKYNVETVCKYTDSLDEIFEKIDGYDGIIINDIPSDARNDLLKYCYKRQIETYIVPKISDVIIRGADDITLFDTPLISVDAGGLSASQAFAKRAFDICMGIIAMIPGSIIILLLAIAIKLDDHGPVFFKQKRITKDKREFQIYKLRSMVVDAENPDKYKDFKAIDKDPRITRVGRFIRATRLDELPQIINIIKGDMSWVGPRPEKVELVEQYEKELPEFCYRSKIKGGLTGYAQIYGKYNTSAYDKLRLDLKYIEDYSFLLDIKLIFMTLQIMLRPESTEGFDKAEELEKKKQELLTKENGD